MRNSRFIPHSPSIIRVMKSKGMRGSGYVACRRVFVGELEVKRLRGRPRCRWGGNIEIDL
jgi:hypothetical protein